MENVKVKKRRVRKSNFFVELIKVLIISFFLFVIITTQVARKTVVDGTSMVPTLEDGEQVVINVLATKIGTINRFDIVVFQHEENYLVKRVIGLPLETIEMRRDVLFINGKEVAQPFLDTPYHEEWSKDNRNKNFSNDFKITLKEDEYVVLGDNRPFSKDSSSRDFGSVHKDDIIGIGGWIVYPFARFGAVK